MNDLFRMALDASFRIALVAGAVGLILMAARVREGAVRHAGWTAVLCAMLLMPILPRLTPEIGMKLSAPGARWAFDTVAGTDRSMAAKPVTDRDPSPRRTSAVLPPELPQPAPQSAPPGPGWPAAALTVYLAGFLFMLTRLAAGWWSARRLARAATPIAMPPGGVAAYESSGIVTPLMVGVLDPRILLPRGWTAWSEATRCAVLAHEMAHLRRRDTLIAWCAGVNRCVFWFHPLAWWLQRELASTAEQACDDAGVRAMGKSREYAEVLLEMAEAVRAHGGRLAWQGAGVYGAGMYGGGSLQKRIDRILNTDLARSTPRGHKALVAVGCAVAIFFGAACRRADKVESSASVAAARTLDNQESYRQGAFYAAVLMKLPEAYAMARLTPEDYRAQAAEIRKRLERATDRTLLLETSSRLLAWGKIRQKATPADFDLFGLGKSALQRALLLDPKSVWAHSLMNVAVDQELLARLPEAVWQGPLDGRHLAIQALPEGERFRELAILAIAAGDQGLRADRIEHDAVAAKAAWQQAGRYAREALDMAAKAQSHPDYGTAFFQANMVLGMEAMQGGDTKSAAAYLLKAAQAPPTDALKYPIANARPWPMNWRYPYLAAELLKAGQRDTVVQFLESYARITVSERDRCLQDVALIRQGKLPSWTGI